MRKRRVWKYKEGATDKQKGGGEDKKKKEVEMKGDGSWADFNFGGLVVYI